MNKIVKLNESELNNLITSIVKESIGETTRRQKAQRAVYKGDSNIRTYAIMTAENPMAQEHTPAENKAFNKELIDYLKLANYVYFPIKGSYGNKEHSFIIYNISLKDTIALAKRFNQQSCIWADNDTGMKEFWQQNDNGDFEKAVERDHIVDVPDADDFFSQISKNKKIQIQFFDDNPPFLTEHSRIIGQLTETNLKAMNKGENYKNYQLNTMLSENTTSRGKYEARGILYRGFQNLLK